MIEGKRLYGNSVLVARFARDTISNAGINTHYRTEVAQELLGVPESRTVESQCSLIAWAAGSQVVAGFTVSNTTSTAVSNTHNYTEAQYHT